MPKTLKQYYRRILVSLGLFDEGAFRLVIDRVFPDDTFIVSYPKSGNTWMRFLLANILAPEKAISFRNIDEIVPDVYMAREKVNSLRRPRFIKAHDPWFGYYPKTIYLVRDYRDVLVSYYHYQRGLNAFSGTISEFAEKIDTLHPFGSWADHTEKALAHSKAQPGKLLFVRYEDLLEDTEAELERVLAFTRLKSSQPLSQIIENCRFAQLRENESKHGSEFMDRTSKHFFRKGQQGDWKNFLRPGDFEKIPQAKKIADLLQQLGYKEQFV
jgi:hypothetical protein